MKTANKMIAVMMAAAMAGCGSSPASSGSSAVSGVPGSEPISIAIINDITTMDLSLVTDGASSTLVGLCQSSLTQRGPDGMITADLAESWETSEDGLTWTFHLRPGIKWSDGSDITADDFVYGCSVHQW